MREADEGRQAPARCRVCGQGDGAVSSWLGVCRECLGTSPAGAGEIAEAAHAKSRRVFALPVGPPRSAHGVTCRLCANECVIGEGQKGFCGLRTVRQGKLVHLAGTPQRGFLQSCRDPLPTNCVAHWVCGCERAAWRHNLAVFYRSCTADCLFCQNWHFRTEDPAEGEMVSADELAGLADDGTFCVCFFGGDPSSQMGHALAAAKRFAERGVRVCWETNGTMHPKHLARALDYSIETGGCVKFDLKALDDGLHRALTGVSNRRTLGNFEAAAARSGERRSPPAVVASTLLLPGYIDAGEVEKIARFIAKLDRNIPYALLAFAPAFMMDDLPRTTTRDALEAEAAAREAGLTNVRIGNTHLLRLV